MIIKQAIIIKQCHLFFPFFLLLLDPPDAPASLLLVKRVFNFGMSSLTFINNCFPVGQYDKQLSF